MKPQLRLSDKFCLHCAAVAHIFLGKMKKKDILHEYFSSLGRKSAKSRMKKISPEDRSRFASEAAKARWAREDVRKSGGQK